MTKQEMLKKLEKKKVSIFNRSKNGVMSARDYELIAEIERREEEILFSDWD